MENFRLQLLNHPEIFTTREEALTYIDDNFRYEALLAEPAVVFYGTTDNPKMILVVGGGNKRVCTIDVAEIKENLAEVDEASKVEQDEVASALTTIKEVVAAAGLDFDENKKENQVTYKPDKTDSVLTDTTTLAEAIATLSKYVQKSLSDEKLSVADTKSVKLKYVDGEEAGKVLKAHVQISADGDSDDEEFNDNILGIKSDGLYAAAHLSYDEEKNQLVFTTSGMKDSKFKDDAIKNVINLGKHAELTAKNPDDSPVKLVVKKDDESNDQTIKATLKLSSNENNIAEVEDGNLIVRGLAKNIKYKDGTVAEGLNDLNKRTSKLERTINIIPNDTNTIDLTIAKDENGSTTLSGDIKRSSDNSIAIDETGIRANIDVEIDTTTNELTLKVGSRSIVKKLPTVDFTTLIKNVVYTKETKQLRIVFSSGNEAVISVEDLFVPYTFKSDDNSSIKLTAVSDQDGTGSAVVKASVSLRSSDNLIGEENGELFVSQKLVQSYADAVSVVMNEKISAALEKLDAETEARKEADSEINSSIKEVKDNLAAETTRADEVEKALNDRLTIVEKDNEAVKAVADEAKSSVSQNTKNISEIETNLSVLTEKVEGEVRNRVDGDSSLQDKINSLDASISDNADKLSSITTKLDSEITRATAKDDELTNLISENTTRINNEKANLSSDISAVKNDLILLINNNTEAITKINSAATVAGSIREIVSHAQEDLAKDINSESERAIAKEADLDSKIEALSTAVGNGSDSTLAEAKAYADTVARDAVDTAATDAANKADSALSDAKAYADDKLAQLKEKLERDDSDLSSAIEAAKSDANSLANAYTDEKVKDEASRAQLQEQELDAKLTTKIENVEVVKSETSDLEYTLLVDGKNAGTIKIPEDQFLKSVEYLADTKEIRFIFRIDGQDQTVDIQVSDFVETYNAGDGLELSENNTFSVKKASDSEEYLVVTADGVKVVGINAKLLEKADKADVYSKAEADAKFLTEHQDLSSLATIASVDTLRLSVEANKAAIDKINGNEAAEGSFAKAIKNAVEAEKERAESAEKSNADAITVLNANEATEGSVANALKQAKEYIDAKGYITDDEVEAKGYLTEHQSLDNLASVDSVEAINEKADKNADDIKTLQSEIEANKLNVVDTSTVSLEKSVATVDSVPELKATVKLDNADDNIIKIKDGGLYAQAELSYDKATNTLTFNGKNYVLSGVSLVKGAEYDAENKQIILHLLIGEVDSDVTIPVGDLVDTYTVVNGEGSAIQLNLDENNVITADVNVSSEEHNLLSNINGSLYASNRAEDHRISHNGVDTSLSEVVEGVSDTVDTFSTEITRVTELVSTLETQVNSYTATIQSLQSTITQLQSDNAGLQSKVTELSNTVESQQTTIKQLKGDVTTINETVSEEAIKTVVEKVVNEIDYDLGDDVEEGWVYDDENETDDNSLDSTDENSSDGETSENEDSDFIQ